MQEAALLDGTSARRSSRLDVNIAITAAALARITDARGRQMRDVLGKRVLRAYAASIDGAGFAGFGECVVA
jgi:hypothetical protein